jgi:hypothetical protein
VLKPFFVMMAAQISSRDNIVAVLYTSILEFGSYGLMITPCLGLI